MRHLNLLLPYAVLATLVAVVGFGNLHIGADSGLDIGGGSEAVDPVCRMPVNTQWNRRYTVEGVTYHFCTERCRDLFVADPAAYLGVRCIVCNRHLDADAGLPVTYLEHTYRACGPEHRAAFQADPAAYFMHRMWGIPDWLYYVSIGLILVVSFGVFEGAQRLWAGREATDGRFDLLRWAWLRRLATSRPLRFALQAILVLLFLLILAAGLFGHPNPALNIAPLATWTIWWCGLVVLILYFGKAWCTVCPWDALAGWMERARLWRKSDTGLGLGLPWPRWLRNIWPATILFVGLTWVELGFGVTLSPRATAYLGLAMLVLAIVCVFLFDRRSFCRYGCLVGRVSGLYALFSAFEVRARDAGVCAGCRSRECVRGSDTAYPCPTFEKPFQMRQNTYCIQCGECLQACPHDNMTVNLRPWGADLVQDLQARHDEAYLCLLMLSISAFHGLTMTPVWQRLLAAVGRGIPGGAILHFSLAMAALLALPVLVYAILVGIAYGITRRYQDAAGRHRTYADYFIHYAYCLLPIALFYHLAHNLEHLLMEGPKIVARLSDPFGWQWNLFGTAAWKVPPLVSLDVLWVLQVLLVGIGHVYSLWAARKITDRFFPDRRGTTRGQVPILIGMIIFSVLSLWLLKQPMEMRSSAM